MSAALAIADALGVDARAAAELLPVIETLIARHPKEQMDKAPEGLNP